MASNITVTITLRDKVSSPMKKVAKSTQQTQSAFQRMGATAKSVFSAMGRDVKQAIIPTEKLKRISLSPLKKQFVSLGTTIRGVNKNTNQLTKTVARLAATYLGVMGGKAAINMSDTIISARNRIGDSNGTGWDSTQTEETLQKIYSAANRARTSYTDMMSNVGKSMALASEAFDNNVDNAIRFQEIMGKAYAISGASAAEMSSSMYQLQQALSSGVLQGDELRSVREGATLAYQEIEKFAQKLYNTDASLKDMASEGKITSDVVTAAILQAGDTIDARFKKTRMTIGQMWTMFKNDTIEAFRPVSEKLNEIANSPAFQKIAVGISELVEKTAAALMVVLNIVQYVVNFIADHWGIMSKIIVFFVALMVASLIFWAATAVAKFLWAGTQVALYILKIVALVAWYSILAVASWVSALAMGAAWAWVVFAILMVIAAILLIGYAYAQANDVAYSVIGSMVGMALFLWECIKNIGKWIANLFIGVFEFIGNAWVSAIWYMVTALGGLVTGAVAVGESIVLIFKNAFTAIANLGIEAINFVLKMWNGLMGVLPDNVKDKFGLKNATMLSKFEYDTSYNWTATAWGKVKDKVGTKPDKITFDRFDYGDPAEAYANGYDIGSKWGKGISDKIKSGVDKLKSGVDKIGSTPTSVALNPTGVGGTNVPAGAGDTGGSNNVGKIKSNTDSIKDSLDNLDEDFSYLIEIAERDAINRFTTASIKVEMSNTNNIREDADIDGIINTLSSRLSEELSVVAAGTHY